ncbi:DUF6879 family protein [Trebonia sp.]|uniref:DUF6879 family protein n=1 Tax=Trebonia sp. TaxID=2767075 RepID=UPI0026116D14|nr:DUF6879 family protein [Trebonia sp.]
MHLETRDAYTPDDPLYRSWLAGRPVHEPELPDWHALVRAHAARGIGFRRARVVSEPLAPFIRYEHEMTSGTNIAAGEDVRWLPRRLARELLIPANDFWVLDSRLIRFGYFAGDGTFLEHELSEDPGVVSACAEAFDAVWERAIPHTDYKPI